MAPHTGPPANHFRTLLSKTFGHRCPESRRPDRSPTPKDDVLQCEVNRLRCAWPTECAGCPSGQCRSAMNQRDSGEDRRNTCSPGDCLRGPSPPSPHGFGAQPSPRPRLASRGLPEAFFGKGPPRACLKVALKIRRLLPSREGQIGHQLPRTMFCSVR